MRRSLIYASIFAFTCGGPHCQKVAQSFASARFLASTPVHPLVVWPKIVCNREAPAATENATVAGHRKTNVRDCHF